MTTTARNKPVACRQFVAAMVLGTALTALGSGQEASAETVNDISRYCTACWRNARLHPDYWSDCTQEVFSRLLERVAPARWDQLFALEGPERREFIRAIDTVKKRSQRMRHWASQAIDRQPDQRAADELRRTADRAAVEEIISELTARQQQIMHKSFDGWSVQEIATQLRLPPERVSDEKYKAIQRLRTSLSAGQITST